MSAHLALLPRLVQGGQDPRRSYACREGKRVKKGLENGEAAFGVLPRGPPFLLRKTEEPRADKSLGRRPREASPGQIAACPVPVRRQQGSTAPRELRRGRVTQTAAENEGEAAARENSKR